MSKMPDEKTIYVIESGSNENGDWIKYSDGTMSCSMQFTENIQITNSLEGIGYYGYLNRKNFPVAFINVPRCFISIDKAEPAYSMTLYNTGNGATKEASGQRLIACPTSNISDITFNVFAIGRWKKMKGN